jgi:hypothetical protein
MQPLSCVSTSSIEETKIKTTENVEPVFIVKAVGGFCSGALSGYTIYWITKGLNHLRFISLSDPITPTPFLIFGAASATVDNTLQLTYKIGTKLLGNRSHFPPNATQTHASFINRLRSYSWQLVRTGEKINLKIDGVFSKVMGVRTLRKIKSKKVDDISLSFVEIVRKAFLAQIPETFSQEVSTRGGLKIVALAGFVFPGAQFLTCMLALNFFLGFQDKISKIYDAKLKVWEKEQEKKQAAEEQEAKILEQQMRPVNGDETKAI